VSTDAFIAFDQTAKRLTEYPVEKSAMIVLYGRSGRMSTIAAEVLVKAGYTKRKPAPTTSKPLKAGIQRASCAPAGITSIKLLPG
jgi:rhodanese-related sulfurtransferase